MRRVIKKVPVKKEPQTIEPVVRRIIKKQPVKKEPINEELTHKSIDILTKEATQLLAKLDYYKLRKFDSIEINKIEKQLHNVRREFQKRNVEGNTSAVSLYPEVDDSDFLKKLSTKKEFAMYQYSDDLKNLNYDDQVNQRCGVGSKFELTKNQKFLKNFLSPHTSYNSLLMFHETGVGKSCTAISIAEEFRSIFSKRVVVLMPTNLKDNFKKQLFDVSKVNRKQMDDRNQCVALKYLEQIADRHIIDNDTLDRRVGQLIKDHYQFYGFREFANVILRIEENLKRIDTRSDVVEAKLNAAIKDMFSDCVMIIDEAHNVRAKDEDTKKTVPPVLLKVLKAATNVKLIIATATPMFNDSREIVWLLNLILANEKRPLIDESDIFDSDGYMHEKGRRVLAQTAKGYVSYMRGQNPFAFPMRLYPTINNDKRVMDMSEMPLTDIYGEPLTADDRINNLVLIKGQMSTYQSDVYREVERASVSSNANDEDDDAEDDSADAKAIKSLSKPIQISNIVYPTIKKGKSGKYENIPVNLAFGKKGFANCFDKLPGKMLKVEYKAEVKKQFGEFLKPDLIETYSAKLKNLIDYILNAEGIVFVYSYYLDGGILPLAIALEHAGFQKRGGQNILSNTKGIEPRYVGDKRATYSILTGDTAIVQDIAGEIEEIRAPKNKNGEFVKVVLGTIVVSEGIDFKCIREVHILEPWHHLNRVEQIVGRAIRTCSHVSLPKEKRNTTVYHHVSIPDYYKRNKMRESIDLRMYRVSELKQKQIRLVEEVLKSNAIDCLFNSSISYFDPDELNIAHDITTSQGKTISNFKVGDHSEFSPYSKITCNISPYPSKSSIGKDTHTFSSVFYTDEVDVYKSAIADMYTDFAQTYDYQTLESKIKSKLRQQFDADILKFTLDALLKQRIPIRKADGLNGFLVYHGHKYTIVPLDEPFSYITASRRKTYHTLESHRIRIANEVSKRPVNSSDDNITQTDLTQMIDVVLSNAKMLTNTLFNKDLSRHDLMQSAIDYAVDRLTEEELLQLASEVFNSERDDELKSSILSSGVIMEQGGKRYLRSPFFNYPATGKKKKELTDVSKPLVKVFVYDTKSRKFKELSKLEYVMYNNMTDTYTAQYKDLNFKAAGIDAFMDISDKGINFKIVGQEAKSSGFICYQTTQQLPVKEFSQMIASMDKSVFDSMKDVKKVRLCEVYELLLRSTKPQKFARPFLAGLLKMNATTLMQGKISTLRKN